MRRMPINDSAPSYFARRLLAFCIDIVMVALWLYPFWMFIVIEQMIPNMLGFGSPRIYAAMYAAAFFGSLCTLGLLAGGVVWRKTSWAPLIAGISMVIFHLYNADCLLTDGSCRGYAMITPLIALAAGVLGAIEHTYRTCTRGQSFGKQVVGLRIEPDGTSSMPFWARILVMRILLNGILSFIPPYPVINICAAFFSQKRRCLHDVLAGTVVRSTGDVPVKRMLSLFGSAAIKQ